MGAGFEGSSQLYRCLIAGKTYADIAQHWWRRASIDIRVNLAEGNEISTVFVGSPDRNIHTRMQRLFLVSVVVPVPLTNRQLRKGSEIEQAPDRRGSENPGNTVPSSHSTLHSVRSDSDLPATTAIPSESGAFKYTKSCPSR
jgi:hypothetical protein